MVSYVNKTILAPMVRCCTLPFRLLALHYGADIAYSEETIDHKIVRCTRVDNTALGTVDIVNNNNCNRNSNKNNNNNRNNVVFRTCELERGKVVFQMGTCDPERALKAAKILEKDVSGLDINMGCPKEFSIQGGMGAALLTKPDQVDKILRTLVSGLSIPVTCKIRILPELEDTLNLVKMIEKTGVKAIGVHGRMKEERSSQPCHDDVIAKVAQTVNIPVIANGGSKDIKKYEDIATFKTNTGCSSVMLARAAQWDPSVFRKEGCLPLLEVMREYTKFAVRYDSNVHSIKYALGKMMKNSSNGQKPELSQKLHGAKDIENICLILNMHDYWLSLRDR